VNKVRTVLGFWNSMTFNGLFHDISEISMSYVKQLFSKYCKNNLLFKVFSHIMTHKMRASVYFFNWNWLVLRLVCCFFNFDFVCLFSLRKFVTFPWLSMTHTSISGLSRPGNWWNYKIPWLSRFSTTRTNPGETTCRDVKHGNQCHSLTITSCPSVTYCSYNGSAITKAPLDALSHL